MPNEPRLKEPAPVIERYEALLQMADLIAGRLTIPELFHELSTRVREVADCSFVTYPARSAEKCDANPALGRS